MLSSTDTEMNDSDTDTDTYIDDAAHSGRLRVVTDGEVDADALTFEEVALTYYSEMLTFVHKLTGNQERAEDIVQDAMVRAQCAWDRWIPEGEPHVAARAWLFRIMANEFTRAYHRTKRYQEVVEADRRSVADATCANGDEHQTWLELGSEQLRHVEFELSEEVRDAIASLAPDHRVIIEMLFVEGVSDRVAAERLGLPIGTLNSRRGRALKQVRKALKRFARTTYRIGLGRADVDLVKTAQRPAAKPRSIDRVMGSDDGESLEDAESTMYQRAAR